MQRKSHPLSHNRKLRVYDARRCVEAMSMNSLNTVSSAGQSEMNSNPKACPFVHRTVAISMHTGTSR